MDVRDLQIFLSVAKHLNYTRAAEEVNLSQPSVSVRMRQLERHLGTKLFEQPGKKIALTEAGELLVPYASRDHGPGLAIVALVVPFFMGWLRLAGQRAFRG